MMLLSWKLTGKIFAEEDRACEELMFVHSLHLEHHFLVDLADWTPRQSSFDEVDNYEY